MTSLIERIKQSRRFKVECSGVVFHGSYLTQEKYYSYLLEKITDAEVARRVVDGWENVKESDLIEGGSDEQVAFSPELFAETIGDHPDWWRAVADEVIKKLSEKADKKEATEKNSRAGSKARA